MTDILLNMQFDIGDLAVVIPIIFLCISVHEATHAFVAHWLGDTTAHDMGRLTLNPLKHVDIITTVMLPVVLILMGLPPIFIANPVPFNPERVKYGEFGSALVGISGPMINLAMAIIGAGILRFVDMPTAITNIAVVFVVINVAFFVFNMIPFPPLDGSRLLYAFAPEPLQKIMYSIERMGLMAILLFFIILMPFLGPVLTLMNSRIINFLLG